MSSNKKLCILSVGVLLILLSHDALHATTLLCGSTSVDSISSAGQHDSFELSGVMSGDVITLRMNNTTTFLDPHLELRDANDDLVASASGATITVTLPSNGPFTALASDEGNNNTGDYELFLERLNGACNPTPLGCGERNGAALPTTARIHVYTLGNVAPGDVITLRMHATSTFLDPYLEVYDGAGTLVGEGAGATLTLSLSSPGPYTVLARDDNYSNEGTYGIFLQRLDDACVPAPLPCGENVAGSTLTTDEVDSFSLSGFESGDAVTLRMQTSIFLDPLVELYNGSGTLLGEGPGPRFTATLSNGGPFTVLARDDGYNNTGEYFLFPQRFEAPCSAASLALGQSKTGTLSAPARIETYILEGIQPQGTITVCMDALTSFGPGVELYDGNGTLLGSDFEFFDGGTAAVTTTLGDSAPFTVLAMDDGFDDTGDYEISLRGAVSSCASTDTTPPTVMSITPEPGELVSAGSRYLIRWSSADDVGVTSHTVRLSTDGGATFPTVLASDLSGAAQSFLWTVPVSMRSTRARIRVVARDATGATGQAETAGDFVLADDPPPREISYSYDSLSRLTGVEYSDGSTITYVYDEVGNRETMTSTGPVVIHEDGFEGGDTSGWTGATGDLEILSEAARTGSFGLRVNVGCPPASDLVVPDGTVASGTFEACTTVRADAVRIDPGPVLFRAGQRVLLGSGFSVASGGRFTVEIDPTMTPDSSVRDDSPSGAERYAARFSVRLDGLDLSAGDRLALFTASAAGGTQPFRLLLERNAGDTENRLIVEARQDDGSVLSSSGFPVPVGAGWHTVELQWRASDPSAADGRIDVILDGTPHARLTGLDNAAGRIDAVELGAMDPSASSTGFIDLDGFRSQPGL